MSAGFVEGKVMDVVVGGGEGSEGADRVVEGLARLVVNSFSLVYNRLQNSY